MQYADPDKVQAEQVTASGKQAAGIKPGKETYDAIHSCPN